MYFLYFQNVWSILSGSSSHSQFGSLTTLIRCRWLQLNAWPYFNLHSMGRYLYIFCLFHGIRFATSSSLFINLHANCFAKNCAISLLLILYVWPCIYINYLDQFCSCLSNNAFIILIIILFRFAIGLFIAINKSLPSLIIMFFHIIFNIYYNILYFHLYRFLFCYEYWRLIC